MDKITEHIKANEPKANGVIKQIFVQSKLNGLLHEKKLKLVKQIPLINDTLQKLQVLVNIFLKFNSRFFELKNSSITFMVTFGIRQRYIDGSHAVYRVSPNCSFSQISK